MADYRQVQIETEKDAILLRFRESWISDFLQIEELGKELYQVAEGLECARLVLDLSSIEFLSSAALGKLISLNGRVKARNRILVLCNLQPQVLDVFLKCRLDRLFVIKKTPDDAVAPA